MIDIAKKYEYGENFFKDVIVLDLSYLVTHKPSKYTGVYEFFNLDKENWDLDSILLKELITAIMEFGAKLFSPACVFKILHIMENNMVDKYPNNNGYITIDSDNNLKVTKEIIEYVVKLKTYLDYLVNLYLKSTVNGHTLYDLDDMSIANRFFIVESVDVHLEKDKETIEMRIKVFRKDD